MKRMRFVLGLLTGVLLVIALALPTAVLAQESAAATSAEASGEEAATETAAATSAEASGEEAAPETAPPSEPGTTPAEEAPGSPPPTEPGTTQVEVEIDIKPGSDPNSINLKSKGVVPVAVLTADDFDASTVDPETVLFAEASPVRWTMEDVDGDGDLDLILHFKTQELGLTEDSTDSTLTGKTYDGELLWGTDTVNIVPKG